MHQQNPTEIFKKEYLLVPAMLFVCLFTFQACNKSKDNSPPPVIASISPDNGVYNTVIVLNGSNFTSSDTVKINGKKAEIIAVSATQVSVKVPKLAGSGAVTINTSNNKTITGPNFTFTYTVTATTLAGDGTKGDRDGIGSQAQFRELWQMCIDKAGNIYVTDEPMGSKRSIRKIQKDGTVSTYASGVATQWSDLTDGPVATTKLHNPYGLAVNQYNEMFLTEEYFIRKINLNNNTITKYTGSFNEGYKDGALASALYNGLTVTAIDTVNGHLYILDEDNKRLRKISAVGIVSTVLGDGKADIDIFGMTPAKKGGIYFGGWADTRVRYLSPTGNETTIAGAAERGYKDGRGTEARFHNIVGLAEDMEGNLFVADRGNNRIRLIDINGNVTSVAGTSERVHQDGTNGEIKFAGLFAMIYGGEGILYVIDGYRVRKVVLQ